MLKRRIIERVRSGLNEQAAVVLLGPRQVGKTTLARAIAGDFDATYLDLEAEDDRAKLSDARTYLSRHSDRLVVLDEIQRVPRLFETLRGLIDEGRRSGSATARFLLLGSASLDLLQQASESLAGRVRLIELAPFDVLEVDDDATARDRLWLRGGFPGSFLSTSDEDSLGWRKDFIRSYLEREIPQFGSRIPAETLRRFWAMLAHLQGSLLNASRLGTSLGVKGQTVSSYADLMVDLLLVRRLQPFHVNVGKRLVKSPKLYIRDSGLAHALLNIVDLDTLLGHPVAGPSWEGFVIEQLINAAPTDTVAGFYRTTAGAEIDLLLELPGGDRWAIEVKRGSAPKLERGFHQARTDLAPRRAFVVHSGTERYPLPQDIEAVPLRDLAADLAGLSQKSSRATAK